MRLFVASDLSEENREHILQYQPGKDEGVRLTPSIRQHMTLQFIGDEDPDHVHKALQGISFSSFETHFKSTGIFSPKKSKHILWLGVHLAAPLIALHDSVTEALADHHIHTDARPYTPHITLARCKRSMNRTYIDDFLNQSVEPSSYLIKQFHLFHSHNVEGQLRYDILQSYPSR